MATGGFVGSAHRHRENTWWTCVSFGHLTFDPDYVLGSVVRDCLRAHRLST